MNTPTFPRIDTLTARALKRLIKGQGITHRDFQVETASYRLASYIESLRSRHCWPIETKSETAPTNDPAGRYATYSRYLIGPVILAEIQLLLGGRLRDFIKAVDEFERRKCELKVQG